MRFSAKHIFLLCVAFFVMAALVQTGFAQTFSSSIAGTVTDPTGSVVPGAKIHLRNMATNDTRNAVSTGVGSYKFDNLLPGTYEITADAPGFKTFVRSNMILRATTAATVDVQLAVGTTEQRVEVSAQAVLLDTQTANNTATLDSQAIQSIPNSYRSPLNFVFALAGTTEGQGGMTTRSGTLDQNGSMFGLNGGRTGNTQILMDGAPSTAVDWGGLFVAPNVDAVQEFQIVQSVYDAQYQRSGAGVVTLITKGGGQKFHGSLYDYMRNSTLDANSWSNKYWNGPNAPKDKFHRNQFGGTFSGPIPGTRRLFFFAAYEGLRQPGTVQYPLTVPTDLERSGDFRNVLNADGSPVNIYNPFTTRLTDSAGNACSAYNGSTCYYTRDPFPTNNVIPVGLIDPVGHSLANLYPHANRPSEGLNDSSNFYGRGGASTVNDKIDWRIDWETNSKNRMFVRMSDRLRQNIPQACFFCNGADNNYDQTDQGFQLVLNDTYTPSPSWVIQLYAAGAHWLESQIRTAYTAGSLSAIGLSPDLSQVDMTPRVSAGSYSPQGADWADFNRYGRANATWLGNVTKQFTRHTLQFGANYDLAYMNNHGVTPITMSFGRAFTSCDPLTDTNGNPVPGAPCVAGLGSSKSGNEIASMLLGVGSGQGHIRPNPAMAQHAIGLYMQDQWRVTDRLTLTAGLRYENQRPATERHNQLAYFNPDAVNPIGDMVITNAATGHAGETLNSYFGRTLKGAFEYASSSHRSAWGPDNRNFAPRLGIAYKLTNKLVARVGAGMFYSPTSAMISFDDPGEFLGFSQDTNWYGSLNGGYTPDSVASHAFPNGLIKPVGSANGAMTQVGDGTWQMWLAGRHKIGYTEQWSADLQYELGHNSVLQVGYMASRGRQLMYGNPDINIDQLPTQYLTRGRAALNQDTPNPFLGLAPANTYLGSAANLAANQFLRPFPQFTYLQPSRSLPGASSQYDSLNVKFTKHFSNGLSLLSSYVYSRALDDGSEDLIGWSVGGLWSDFTNTKRDYAISTHDVPQSFATQFYYQLPYGQGKKFGGNAPAVVKNILGNWEVSGVVRLSSGLPIILPYYGWNGSILGNYGLPWTAWANLVGNPTANQSPSHWINAAAFQPVNDWGQDTLSLGNTPTRISSLREAATKNVDFGVAKVFGPERFKVRFGAEFLNLFNHPVYGQHWNFTNLNDPGNFGIVQGTRNDPRNIQMSLKLTF